MRLTKIKKKIKFILSKPEPLVKVYSHPRSGTHFLEAFLAENFYKNKDLEIKKVIWGHWSHRITNSHGNKYGKLFGNHYFPDRNQNSLPKLYIYRDGRAVAYSIWKTENFIHVKHKDISFDDFLREKIDWRGSPANKHGEKKTIFEHWAEHVYAWKQFAGKGNVLLLKYEDLVKEPKDQYKIIHERFFNYKKVKKEDQITLIKKPIGLLPNEAIIDAWKGNISEENLEQFQKVLRQYKINEYKL
jgi:hypothetical protein